MVGLDDVDNGLDQRGGREEFTVVVRLLDGELGEEVLVDFSEDIARCAFDLLAVEEPHQLFEHFWLENAVVLWQNATQRFEVRFDRVHRLCDNGR